MNYFNILGIDKGASKDEIRQAYNNQVNKFKNEISDEKRAEKFLKLFKEAHDELIKQLEEQENIKDIQDNEDNTDSDEVLNYTVKMSAEEIQEIIKKANEDKEKKNLRVISKEEFLALDNNEEKEVSERVKSKNKIKSKSKKRVSNKNSSKSNSKNSKEKGKKEKSTNANYNVIDEDSIIKTNKRSNNIKCDIDENKTGEQRINKKQRVIARKQKNSSILKLIKIPFKILALPIILILSVIIGLCKLINLACFLVSKVMITGAIAVASIHGYQIYIGEKMQWQIFALCVIGFLTAIFLPYIVKIIPSILGKINSLLKDFVF